MVVMAVFVQESSIHFGAVIVMGLLGVTFRGTGAGHLGLSFQ